MTDQITTESDEQNETEPEGDTFPRSYVEKLRQENADARVSAKAAQDRADAMEAALRASALREGAGAFLVDAADLPWSEDFITDDGMPDIEKISEAAEALSVEKPHLAKARGDIGQGLRGEESGTVDLAGILRSQT